MSVSTCRRCTRLAQPDKALTDAWTWENFLTAAEKCSKGGHPFGIGLSTCTDAINMAGAVFASLRRGAGRRGRQHNGQVDATKQALDWFKRLSKSLPDSVYAYDNASNNKALISGQSRVDLQPTLRLCGRRRDQPKIAEQLWTFHSPTGPKGRFDPAGYYYWGIWNFSKNIPAAKSLLTYLTTREMQQKLVTAGVGFDIPPFNSFMDFKIWDEVEPPKGTVYNFPPRNDAIPNLVGYPAPLKVGTQMWAQATIMKLIAQHTQSGKSADDAIAWAQSELEGFSRS